MQIAQGRPGVQAVFLQVQRLFEWETCKARWLICSQKGQLLCCRRRPARGGRVTNGGDISLEGGVTFHQLKVKSWLVTWPPIGVGGGKAKVSSSLNKSSRLGIGCWSLLSLLCPVWVLQCNCRAFVSEIDQSPPCEQEDFCFTILPIMLSTCTNGFVFKSRKTRFNLIFHCTIDCRVIVREKLLRV